MTDAPAPADATPPATPQKPKKKRRTWRQRFKILVLVLLIGAFLFRIALNFLLPTVINKVAGIFDLEVGYDRLKLSLLGGTANIYGLKVRPKEGGESILQSDYIQGDISPFNLLRGKLIVHRAEVDGVILAVDREKDGSIPLLKHFLSAANKTQPAAAPATSQPLKPMSLDAPLRVDAIRVSHVTVRLRDRSVTPAFEAVVQTTLRVNNVGTPGDPARIELDVGIDPLLDTFRVSGEAHTSPDELSADVNVLVRGLHPKQAAGYLAMLGVKPVANDVTVQANAKLHAKTIPNSADFSANLAVSDVKASTDGAHWASLESLELSARRLGASGAEIEKLSIRNGDVSARRTTEGCFELAGLQLDPAIAARPPATQSAATPTPVVTVTSAPPFRFALDELDLQKLSAVAIDEAVSPAAKIVARLDSLNLRGVDTASQKPVPLSLAASLPGIVKSVAVKGDLSPFTPAKTASLHVVANGIRPDAIKPYLERFGLQSEFNDGQFAADLNGSFAADDKGILTASGAVTNVKLSDGDTSLAELAWAKIDGLSFTPADGSIAVKSIDGSGPAITVIRTADNRIRTAGMTFVGLPTVPQQTKIEASTATAKAAPATAETAALKLPKINLGHFGWGGVRLTLEDLGSESKSTFVFDDAGVDIRDLLLDLGSANPERKPGQFVAWLAAPGIADTLKASGTFAPGPNRLTSVVEVAGDGITLARLSPYLKPLGIVPTLSAGKVAAKASATLSQTDAGIGVDLEAHDVVYTDGPAELAGVDYFGVSGLALSAKRIDVDAMNISRLRIRVARDADGTLRAAGIHLVPVAAEVANPASLPATAPATLPAEAAPLKLPPLPIELGLKALRVADATIDWADAVPAKPATIHAVASVALDNVNIAPNASPAKLHLAAHVDGALDAATVDGTLGLDPQAPAMKLAIKADGLRAGPLGSYLPANLEPTLRDGHFETALDLGVSNHAEGGLAAHVAADSLTFADGQTQLAKVDAFKLTVNRVDPAAGVFALGELSSRGVVAGVKQTPSGLETLGLRVVTPVGVATTQPAVSGATEVAPPSTAPSSSVGSLSSMVADARRPLPHITLDKLDLGLEKFTASGFTGPDAAPVAIENLTITSPGSLSFGGTEAENAPPLVVNIAGGVSPVVGKFGVDLTATPFATEPAIAMDIKASGLNGGGIVKVLPALAQRLDGSGLTDGTFTTHLDASVNYGRRGPRDLDLGRGFVATFDVKPLEMRAAPNGPVLAGVQSLHGEGIKVDPKGGNVAVKLIEVATPIARAYRDERGIHAAGLTLLMGANESTETLTATTGPATQPATQPGVTPADAMTNRATEVALPKESQRVQPAQRPANEIRVDRFTVSGVDVVIEDRTSKPPTIVPLKTLDVDVQDLSNQLPWSGKSMRFSLLCTSGKVPLPPRKGIKGQATTQPAEGQYTEQRDLFSQISANGKIGFSRQGDLVTLDGWAKTAVNGFELLGVRGLAQQYGVTIGGGSFDDTNDVRFNKDGNIDTKTKIVFTNLSLSEPANGPLTRLLKLPAPIDVAIGAVTDPDGSITLPLAVPIKNGAVGVSDVIGPALGAVTNVLVTGIASAPMKAVGGLGDLVGLGGNKDAKPEPPVVVNFLPAYAGLDAAANDQISKLGQALKDDDTLELQLRHTLTSADVARAALRANPSPENALALAQRVRQQKADLQTRYQTLQAQARGDFGAQADARAKQAVEALRVIGKQLAQAEQSLDDLYALTTPGAAAQADRRTRAAALDIAHQRLEVLKAAIDKAAGPKVGERVHTTNPQFDPTDSPNGGEVTIVLVRKKH